MQKLSRRKIAEYVADNTKDGVVSAAALKEVAAYLQETRRTRELPLVVRTIEDVLAERGQVVARVTSARPLEAELRKTLESQIGGTVYMQETVDEAVLGGVKVTTPGRSLDATLMKRINSIRSAKQA
ncbi:MAG: F0F1 ATP synthase subunit delta [Candidatus Saccharimonadales bacterium]